jgi:hypothetical protein
MTQIFCKGLLVDMDGVLVDSTPAFSGKNEDTIIRPASMRARYKIGV